MHALTRPALMAIALLVTTAPAAFAQVGERGAITGTVKDAQGGAMPGVTATAVSTNTNVATTATTNESGIYLLNALLPGTYKVTLTLEGFAPVARQVDIRAGDRLQIDIVLSVGALSEEVKVVAETPLLQTTNASRATVIDQEKVENLRMSGRNPFTLAQIAPGVVGEAGDRQSIQREQRRAVGRAEHHGDERAVRHRVRQPGQRPAQHHGVGARVVLDPSG